MSKRFCLRLPDVQKTCEICGPSFVVPMHREATARTCSARCRNTRASRVSAAARIHVHELQEACDAAPF